MSGGLGWGFGNSGKPDLSFKDSEPALSASTDVKEKIKLSRVTEEIALGYNYFLESLKFDKERKWVSNDLHTTLTL